MAGNVWAGGGVDLAGIGDRGGGGFNGILVSRFTRFDSDIAESDESPPGTPERRTAMASSTS